MSIRPRQAALSVLKDRARRAWRPRPAECPTRPSLPPLLLLGLGTWAGAAAGYGLAEPATVGLVAVLATASLVLASIGAVLWARCGAPTAACLVLGLLLGAGCGLVGALDAKASALDQPRWGAWSVELSEDARPATRGWRALGRVVGKDGRGRTVSLTLYAGGEGLLAGEVVEVRGTLRPTGDDGGYSWSRALDGRLTAQSGALLPAEGPLAPLRELRRAAIKGLTAHGGAAAPLMQALACGYRAPLDEAGGYGAYQACGLAHLVAVSGAHLSLVALGAGALMRALRLPRVVQALVTLGLVGGFLVFSGLPVSALRAALMTASSLGALLARRRPAALSALGGCLVLFPALDPPTALSASFVLSAGSTLGIVLFAGLIGSWLSFLPGLLRRALGEPVALTLASAVITQPYAAALFAQVPLIAPAANVAAAPLFTLACLASLMAAVVAAVLPAAASFLVPAAATLTQPLDAAARALGAVPHASVPADVAPLPMAALSALAAVGLYRAWPRLRPRILAGVAALGTTALAITLFVAPLLIPTQIVMVDVGQGDAILLRSRGAAVLVDTGNQDSALLRALARHGVWRLDAVAVTHHDDDHCGSLDALARAVPVGRVIVAAEALDCPCGPCGHLREEARALAGEEGLVGVSAGDALACGDLGLTVLWPRVLAEEGGNGDSLCLLATAPAADGRWTALLTGDAEAEQLHALDATGDLGPIDVLKVGHHGSAVSLDEPLAARLAPAVALVSAGENNRYGHPRPEPLAALGATGATVFRTDWHGDVAVTLAPEALRVDAQRPHGGETQVE